MTRRASKWYAVRCAFRRTGPYEERITLWHAADLGAAIALVEAEASEYAEATGVTYLGLAQAYEIGEEQPGPGTEVFSLLRDSAPPPVNVPAATCSSTRTSDSSSSGPATTTPGTTATVPTPVPEAARTGQLDSQPAASSR